MHAYHALARLGGHRTADEVADAVAAGGHHVSRMSVYNALDALRSAGLVMVAETGRGPTLHEVAADGHHHFVCRVCGAVIDVPCTSGDVPCTDVTVPGAEVDEALVILRGTCPDCLAARSRS
jgi:Fe2+ or Zn2+ uptake regulation protein